MDKKRAEELALSLMAKYGLRPIWNLKFDGAKRRLGLCNYRTKTISLSLHHVLLDADETVIDTILHEIAHAMVGPGHGHGSAWRNMAVRVGAKPRSCADGTGIAKRECLYNTTCPKCQRQYGFHRLRRSRKYYCPCGKGTQREPLVWETNLDLMTST